MLKPLTDKTTREAIEQLMAPLLSMSRGFSCKALPKGDLDHVFGKVAALWEKLRNQRIFITGGTGFFGKWLLETLIYANHRLDLNCRITVLSRNPGAFVKNNPNLRDPAIVSFVSGDVRDFGYPDQPHSYIIHAATDVIARTSAAELFLSCVEGTRRVLDFASKTGCTDLLLVSSGAVYGAQPAEMVAIPETYRGAPDTLDAKSAYGEGKRGSEFIANACGEEHGFGVKVARCFSFVGPHLPIDKHFAIGNFIRDALVGGEVTVQGDGTSYRSYLYAADLAIWLWTILLRAPAGAAYNVGGDEAVSIADLARRVTQIAGSNREAAIWALPDSLKAAERYLPDVQKAELELGLKTWIPLDEAIHRTLQWLR